MDFNNAKAATIDCLCDSVFYLQIDSVELIPPVDYIKTCDEYLFLFSSKTNQIFIIDKQGNLINVLKKRGRGPNEYVDIGTFAYDPAGETLVIHARSTRELIRYSVPDLKFRNRWAVDAYFNSLTTLHGGKFIGIKEADVSSGAIELIDINKRDITTFPIKTNTGSLEVSVDPTFSMSESGEVFYAQPGQNTSIIKFDNSGNYQEAYYLNFGRYGIPVHYWEQEDCADFGKILSEAHYATMVQFFIDRKETFSFWFLTWDENNPIQLYIYNKIKNSNKYINKITIPGYKGEIVPVGMCGGFYIACLYNYEFDGNVNSGIDPNLRTIVKNNIADQPILVFFKLKDS